MSTKPGEEHFAEAQRGYSHLKKPGETDYELMTIDVLKKVILHEYDDIRFFSYIMHYFDFKEANDFWKKVFILTFSQMSLVMKLTSSPMVKTNRLRGERSVLLNSTKNTKSKKLSFLQPEDGSTTPLLMKRKTASASCSEIRNSRWVTSKRTTGSQLL